jgi:hypothetical protein
MEVDGLLSDSNGSKHTTAAEATSAAVVLSDIFGIVAY